MEITVEQMSGFIASTFWPMVRIGSFVMLMPILGSHHIPVKIKLLLIVLLTIAIVPTIQNVPAFTGLNDLTISLLSQQIIIGLLIAFVFQLIFQLFVLGGQLIALQTGLGFATMVDPNSKGNIPLVSQFYLLLVSLVFVSLNGHLLVIQLIAESFNKLPISAELLSTQWLWQVLLFSGWVFKGGLLVTLPAVIGILSVNIAIGMMTRFNQQLNLFSVGLSMSLLFGLFIIYFTMNGLIPNITGFLQKGLQVVENF